LPGETADRPAILARVCALLAERLGLEAHDGPRDEATGLLGQGIGLDSVEVLQLVSAIEETWGLTIDDDDLKREHFATLGTLVTFIQERLPA
jgi:acyl carrier protein